MPYMTDVAFQTLPPHMQQYYKDMMSKAEAIRQEDFLPYKLPRIAPKPDDILFAHHLGRAGVGTEAKQLAEASDAARRGSKPFYEINPLTRRSYIDDYMNPYQRHVVQQIAEEGNRNFTENVLPALEARFVKLGRYGGSKHADLSRRAARDLQHEILSRQQQALASGYQQAGQFYNAQQARELESANQLGNLAAASQGSRLADIAALENQGRYQQQHTQSGMDARYQEFLRQIEHPMQRLAYQSSIMHGIPSQSINQAYYQTPATPQMNVASSLGPLAAQIWATRMMGGGR